MAGSKPGPNHQLDDKELLGRIKKAVFEGKNLKEIAEASGMSEATLYTYHADNVRNIADKIEGWRRDRKLMLADERLEEVLQLDARDKDFTRAVLDASKFVKETLDSKNYSRLTKIGDPEGKALTISAIIDKLDDGSGEETAD